MGLRTSNTHTHTKIQFAEQEGVSEKKYLWMWMGIFHAQMRLTFGNVAALNEPSRSKNKKLPLRISPRSLEIQ